MDFCGLALIFDTVPLWLFEQKKLQPNEDSSAFFGRACYILTAPHSIGAISDLRSKIEKSKSNEHFLSLAS